MEVYVLDDQFRRIQVIDRYESCIWTERYSAFGDFQLVIHSTTQSRGQLPKGTRLAINNSKRVMTVENVEDKDDSEGRSLLTVSGRSLEGTELETRAARRNMNGTDTDPNFVLASNPPAAALRSLFNYIMVNGNLDSKDVLPFYQTGSLYPTNTILEPADPVILSFPPQSLYKIIKEVCDAYGLGFRLYRGPDDSKLYFNIYTGDDRTATQVTKPAVIFSPDLENLANTSEFSSIEAYKNVALVVAKFGSRWVYADSTAETATGFDRKVVVVDASDIDTAAGATLDAEMDQRGREELSKYKPMQAIDGELTANSKYVYGVDYELGDLVEMRNADGLTNRMRVTEQIFVDDAQGERSYPTLVLDAFITPGTWYAWDATGVWDTAPGVWAFAGGEVTDDNLLPNGNLSKGTTADWAGYASSTLSITQVSGEFRSGYGLKVVTTAANGGAAANLASLAESPIGAYTGTIWVKTTSTHGYKVQLQEYTTAGVLVGGSAVSSVVGNGAFQQTNLSYTKTQPGSVLRISVQKDVAGTIYIDDAEIRKVL